MAYQNSKLFNCKNALIVLVILLLSSLIFILTNFKLVKTTESNEAIEELNGDLQTLSRENWNARQPLNNVEDLELPAKRLIILQTETENCFNKSICINLMRTTQSFHMDGLNFDDIGYNFVIGGDGRIYIGRGWNKQGAHTKGYNKRSIGVAFTGTFTVVSPSAQQLGAVHRLIEEGIQLGKLSPSFCIYGAMQLAPTWSPGAMLYNIIKTWPHWTTDIHCDEHGANKNLK